MKNKRTQNNSKHIPKTVEEDLSTIDESELLREEKKLSPSLKKAIVAFIGLVVIFLFISLIYIQYPLFNVIQGQIESKSADSNILQLKNLKIIFTEGAMYELRESFSINREFETSRCLKGELRTISGTEAYLIDEVYTPKIYEQSFRHVTSEPCSEDTLIMFHTHPYKSCVASSTDLSTLKSNQVVNPEIIMIVMCEENRFAIYK